MKNLPIFVETPALWEEEGPYFRAMLDAAEFAQMSREQKRQYREEMRRDWDYKNTMDYALAQGHAQGYAQGHAQGHAEGHAQGKEEGIAEGLEKGRTEGRAEGLAEGKAEGLAEAQRAIARRMLAEGLSVDLVAKYTELTVEQVRGLS